jgi:hypothetical protein
MSRQENGNEIMSSNFPASVKAPPHLPAEHPHFRDGSLVDKWQPVGPALAFVVARAALIRWGEPAPPPPAPPWGDLPCPPGSAKDWE